MKYLILGSDSLYKLSDIVNEHLEKGWKPLGTFVIQRNYEYNAGAAIWTYYQAIIFECE